MTCLPQHMRGPGPGSFDPLRDPVLPTTGPSLAPLLDDLADRLAGPGWAVVDGFLGEAAAQGAWRSVVEAWEGGRFQRAAVGAERGVLDDVRRDETWWIDETSSSELLPLLARVDELRAGLSRALALPLAEIELHAARYAPGAYYQTHVDELAHQSARRISLAWYANPDWRPEDGGELRLHTDPVVDVLPLFDRLVVFRSEDVPHEVLSPGRERWSVTGWMRLAPRDGLRLPRAGRRA